MAFGVKGQISIEFVLILLVGLIYLQTIQITVIDQSINSAKDVSNVGEARLAASKIVESVNELAAADGTAKKTIHVFVPEKTTISCLASNGITFTVSIDSDKINECKQAVDGDADNICTKTISFSTPSEPPIAVECSSFPAINQKSFATVSIEKTDTEVTLSRVS